MAQLLRTYRIDDIEENVPRGTLWRSLPGMAWHPAIAQRGFIFLGSYITEEHERVSSTSTFKCYVNAMPLGKPLPTEFLFVEFPAPNCNRPNTWPSGTYAEMFVFRWKSEFVRM